MKFMDFELARRVEMAEASAGRACAECARESHPELSVAIEEIAGGFAVFAGVDSPVTQMIGLGMNGLVEEADLDRVEEFYRSRGAAVALEICPLVDICLYQLLAKRGYRLAEVSNVHVRELSDGDLNPAANEHVIVRPALAKEAKLWTLTVAQGFSEHYPVTQPILDVMEGFVHDGGACCFLAFIDGEVAGGGAVAARAGVCGLFGASTLIGFRKRGVQSALLAARIAWGRERGCDIGVSITQPASISQRNIERFGFRVAYTRTKLVREWA
jgi:hypothetical protein